MASLGNVGKTMKLPQNFSMAWTIWGLNKNPVSVDMTPSAGQLSEVPFSFVILTRNAVENMRSRSDGSGEWHFFDMDDSGNQVYGIASYTQAGATGEAWVAVVAGGTATVTKTFAANRAAGFAYT